MMSMEQAVSLVKTQKQDYELLRLLFCAEFPTAMKALQIIDHECSEPRVRKGYNLVKRENKKYGHIYYVRYYHDGRMLPSKWNTHTDRIDDAEKFALENRERLIETYLKMHDSKTYELLEDFFQKGSPYLGCEERRNRPLCENTRANYCSVMNKKFIPYLKEKSICAYEEISLQALHDFQDGLLADGMKPQSVNDKLKAVKRVFAYLERKGMIKANPCRELRSITVHQGDREDRGCYDLEKLNGAFGRAWADRKSHLLCLIIYTTGMRNSEIRRIRMQDIIKMEGCRFINIRESKTANGIRLVPLHEFVYKKIAAYASEKKEDEFIFKGATNMTFMKANIALARRMKIGEEEARAQNITFYSGRHFWKTLMNSEGLGESVEELFMGHKVSGDMAKLYNHLDKRGKKLTVKKARQVFSILDRCIFNIKP
jgi:integrase